jgi:hypothetical protein
MTNEQILWLARVRVGLQKSNIRIDLVRVTRDREYLESVLNQASELTDESAVESAMKLMAQLGMINGRRVMDSSLTAEILRRFATPIDNATPPLRAGGIAAEPAAAASSQPEPVPHESGRFSTPIGLTTGSSPAPVPGGKNYKRGLR